MVKKPNKPFKLLITNNSTFNSDAFCPEEHMCPTQSFKFAQKFTPEKRIWCFCFLNKKLIRGAGYKNHTY
jgi:hypothetical protein